MEKINIYDLMLDDLRKILISLKEMPYRRDQLLSWLYKKNVVDFKGMKNIPKELTEKLEKRLFIGSLKIAEHVKSVDGTEKFLLKLSDGNFIETVLIPSGTRNTLCLSTQVGCKFSCPFCASGKKGFLRNLTPGEIIAEVMAVKKISKDAITNYVFMGMGEPLDNWENVLKAILIMNDPKAMAIGARRITVSTCGIIPEIYDFTKLDLQVNLSISLHAADNSLRDKLVPLNKRYPLEKLIKACENYINRTRRLITLEYVLIKGKNDSIKNIEDLVEIARRLRAKVNVIPYSDVSVLGFSAPSREDTKEFLKNLTNRGINATLRESKGVDISAACGQLAGKIKK
ncbi:MAG: 23S rRNA (adenine(2503)-C(2))-methyltransferase RlmN [Candidatus Omnitrophica bacterium]|nr:23S rRNA (adenine(2503)-C(2))-methyltransferase RlmN [Candidatus Omnitrophota bacterium]